MRKKSLVHAALFAALGLTSGLTFAWSTPSYFNSHFDPTPCYVQATSWSPDGDGSVDESTIVLPGPDDNQSLLRLNVKYHSELIKWSEIELPDAPPQKGYDFVGKTIARAPLVFNGPVVEVLLPLDGSIVVGKGKGATMLVSSEATSTNCVSEQDSPTPDFWQCLSTAAVPDTNPPTNCVVTPTILSCPARSALSVAVLVRVDPRDYPLCSEFPDLLSKQLPVPPTP